MDNGYSGTDSALLRLLPCLVLYGVSTAMKIQDLIIEHYKHRSKRWPSTAQALMFTATELGESFDALLEMEGGWVRNHPERHPGTQDALVDELADTLLMLYVTAMTIDPNLDLDAYLRWRLETCR